jgi:hypothetical protein
MIPLARPWTTLKPLGPARVLACAALLGLAACSRGNPLAQLAHMRAPAHAAASAAHPADAPTADMVAAVALGKTSVPVDVRFALRERPEVGQPATLDLLVTPSAPLERLVTSFRAEDGLKLRDGGDPSVRERPEPGIPIPHTLTVVAQQDGIFYVSATVLADLGSEQIAHTFTIPVIAGGGAQ